MPKSAPHLRLVASNANAEEHATEIARKFRETMREHIRAHTEGTNVNSQTLLATDYLNHFNEAVMLLEMMPSAPAEIAADLAGWRHETYEEHFHESGFRDKALAIAAYRFAPPDVRQAFDRVTYDIALHLRDLLKQVLAGFEAGDSAAVSHLCMEAIPGLQAKIETASAIINGELRPQQNAASAPTDPGAHQAAVDELFD